MYLRHFGLREKPFAPGDSPSFYYPTVHQEAQNDLSYSIEERQGLATLIGEPGTGKTTLLKRFLRSFSAEMQGILVSDVALSGGSLLMQLALELRLRVPEERTTPMILQSYFQNCLDIRRVIVVLIDEAQALTDPQLHEVRYLSNLEYGSQKLLQIVLAGQPSLESKFEEPEFDALRHRVAVRAYLAPFNLEHTQAYIKLRLQVAGAQDVHLFTPRALSMVHELSRGVPRLVNWICDRALLLGYAEGSPVIDETAVQEASDELKLEKRSSPAPATGQKRSSIEPRLDAIERKLDLLLLAMERAGFLPPAPAEESTQGGQAPPNAELEAERLERRRLPR